MALYHGSTSLSLISSDSSSDDEFDEYQNILNQVAVSVVPLLHHHIRTNACFMEMQNQKGKHGGSTFGRIYIRRARVSTAYQLEQDYFVENSTYLDADFRSCYRMSKKLFLRILADVEKRDQYFVQKNDAIGRPGLTSKIKVTPAIRMLAFGSPANHIDEQFKIGKSTIFESLKRFCSTVIELYAEEYMRAPTEADVQRLLKEGEERGFPRMLGSLDCMHWTWRACPTAWHGTHIGHKQEATVILEAVASKDLWIWHAFFGMPGSHNDINVLDRSPLFNDVINGRAPACNFVLNGHAYHMGYYLSDGIYPEYATLIQSISQPVGNKRKYFARKQEAIRKDVERAFGVLQSRWAIIRNPVRLWSKEDLALIMKTCIILHNMIIEDQRESNMRFAMDPREYTNLNQLEGFGQNRELVLGRFLSRLQQIHDKATHEQLKNDLIEHLWQRRGDISDDDDEDDI